MPPEDDKNKPDPVKELADLKAERDALKAERDALKAAPKPDPKKDDQDLAAKAEADRIAKEKSSGEVRAMEAAIKFDIEAKNWLDTNSSLLPKNIASVFETHSKEKYDSAIQKDGAIKAAIVQEFFSVEDNLKLLTSGPKSQVDDYLKLSKAAKEQKGHEMFINVFEPALEQARAITKARAIQKGHADGSDDAYKARMIEASKKHYLGEKSNA